MRKFSINSLLLSLSLACLPLVSQADTSAKSGPVSMSSKPINASCSAGNFTGEYMGYYYDYGSLKSVYLTHYKITKRNNQSGGNKANVNSTFANFAGSGSKVFKSPDSMKQDGNWHKLDVHYNAPWAATQVRVEFIFDKSGSDPRCDARQNL